MTTPRPQPIAPQRIVYQPPQTLLAYTGNARRHPPSQIAALVASIRTVGFLDPVLITAENIIVAGHARVEAALQASLKKIPTILLDGMTAEQVKAFRIADNRLAEMSSWEAGALTAELESLGLADGNLAALGFVGVDIAGLMEAEAPAPPSLPPRRDTPPPPDIPARVSPGDLWALGRHRLLCADPGDAAAVHALLGGATPNLLIYAPPVDPGKKMRVDLERRAFAIRLERALRHLTKTPFAYIFTTWQNWPETENQLAAAGIETKQMIVWDKVTATGAGQWRPQHELIAWAGRTTPPFIAPNTIGGAVIVATPKRRGEIPEAVIDKLVAAADFANKIVDPAAGIGETMLAAERHSRDAYLMEPSTANCDIILARFAAYTGAEPTRLPPPEANK